MQSWVTRRLRTCLGSSGLGGGILLARFRLRDGRWRSVSLKGEQGSSIQDIAVYGTQETERRILLLSSKKWILTDWMNGLPREIYESIGVAEEEEGEADQERKREGFARDLRADYDLGEFRVSGPLGYQKFLVMCSYQKDLVITKKASSQKLWRVHGHLFKARQL